MAAHKSYYEEMEEHRRKQLARAQLDLARATIRIKSLTTQVDELLLENAELKQRLADLSAKPDLTISGDVLSLQNELGDANEGA